MSLPDVASYLAMGERTIYVWAQQGLIPAFKLGATWRFRRSEIEAWLESQRSGPVVSTPERQPVVESFEPPVPTRTVPPDSPAAIRHWVYEDDPTDKAIIHKSTCGHCNDGRGRKASRLSDNRWHGPFASLQEAIDMALGTRRKTVRTCGACLRGVGSFR